MIEANKNKAAEILFSAYNKRLLNKHFSFIRIIGEENFINRDKSVPVIIFPNHSNWWDGFLAFYLAYNRWNIDSYLMMDYAQMKKYFFFKFIGAFSVDRTSATSSYKSVMVAAELLKTGNRLLWLFPQGKMTPQHKRPLEFESGILKILDEFERVNVFPMAINYEFINEQRPEIFIKIGENVDTKINASKKEKIGMLEEKLTDLLDTQIKEINDGETEEYKIIFKGRTSRNKTIDRIYGDV